MFVGRFLDLLWARHCEVCGTLVGEMSRYLCWDCLAALPVIRLPFCTCCGDPVEGAITQGYLCSACVDRPPAFDAARSAVRFRGAIKDVLHRFKYASTTHVSRDLASLLAACVAAQYGRVIFDAVTYVPLHPTKQRARTYNQARLLAGDLAGLLHKPLADRCLVRVRDTATQTRLTARERAENVCGAFAVRHPSWTYGRRLLLVDDVMTTGSTLREVARVLKEAGAATVHVVTVARG